MAIFMTAMTSELFTHGRSDPEYFLPRHTKVEADLNHVPTVSFRNLGHFSCSAFYPAATHLYSTDGMPFLRCVDIVDFPLISPDQPFARIPNSFVQAHSTVRCLSTGDIVISKVGTPCYAALLTDDMPQCAMTRTVLGITGIDQTTIDPYFLIAFLRSRHGFDQLMRERELTIQYQLTLERTRKIKVFRPELSIQTMIGNMVRAYYQKSRSSVHAYKAAQEVLEAELGLNDLNLQKPEGYTARFSTVGLCDTFAARRVDSQCFAPTTLFYEDWLHAHVRCDSLASLLRSTAKGRQQKDLTNGITDYCSIKHISNRELEGASKCIPKADTPLAGKDDLLLAITGATIGKIGIVKRYRHLAFSGDLLCLRTKSDIDPHYLLLSSAL